MELDRYFSALRRSWKLVLAVSLIGLFGGFFWSNSQPDVYKSTAAVFFQVSGAETTQSLLQGSSYTQNQVRSYAELATKEVVLNPVISELGLTTTPISLSRTLSVNVPLDTAIVEISASAHAPETAKAVADAAAKQLGIAVEQLSQNNSQSSQDSVGVSVDAQVVQQATLPTYPVSPQPKRNAVLGLIVAFVLSSLVALGREHFNNHITDGESLAEVAEVPLIGRIPWRGGRKPKPTGVIRDQEQLEALRRTAMNYEFVNHSGNVKAIVVTSSQPGEGKTTVSFNLAAVLSSTQRVLLLDCDLRKPSVASRFGLEPAVGLTTVITGKATLDDVVQTAGRNLHVVTSGPVPPNPLALIGSSAFAQLLTEARDKYDAVIIDAPPLLPVSDAALLGRVADGVVMVIGSRTTSRKELARAISHLNMAGVPIHGAILTQLRLAAAERGYYGQPPKPAANSKRDAGAPPKRKALIGSASRNAVR